MEGLAERFERFLFHVLLSPSMRSRCVHNPAILTEDFDAEPTDVVPVVIHGLLGKPEEEEEEIARDGNSPPQGQPGCTLRRRHKRQRELADVLPVVMNEPPADPRLQTGGLGEVGDDDE